MARHSESPAFIRYLQNTISDLVAPLEEVASALREDGEEIPDTFGIFNGAFVGLGGGCKIICVNGNNEHLFLMEDYYYANYRTTTR